MHAKLKQLSIWQSKPVAFFIFLLRRIGDAQLNQVAASLTFTTLLALVPFITITFIVISAFPVFADISTEFQILVSSTLMPDASSKVIGTYMNDFIGKAGNLTAIGIVALGISAVLLINTVERTFNQIWQAKQERPLVWRVLIYWTILTLGPLLIGGGLSVWSWLFRFTDFPMLYPSLATIIRVSGAILLSTSLLWAVFRFVPYRYVPNRHALIGALFTAVALEITRRAFGFYVANFNSYQIIYGAFAAIPVFLLWILCLWYVLLSGAVLTASLSYWQGETFRRRGRKRGRFDDVIKVLIHLHDAQKEGKALKTQDFRAEVAMGYDELGELLTRLGKMAIIQDGSDGWVLKLAPENIILSDLFQAFVYRLNDDDRDFWLQHLHALMAPGLDTLDLSLAQFIQDTNAKLI
ncbi:MAG: YihY family inner membrane protein [Neisseriaceae bacterium]|nr:YihY family inner membrane protein [Neisseriaceae bacterium]